MSDPRAALDAIGQLDEAEIDLADAALQLARVDAPDADWGAARAHLSDLARQSAAAARRLDRASATARARALTKLLVDAGGYCGDDETYEDLANANLIRVIERRRGLPVALGVIWIHCARAAGWSAHGLDFPGHFLIAIEGERAPAVLDVFQGGHILDARDLRALLDRVEGRGAPLRPSMMAPMGDRAVLLRLQNNIKVRRTQHGDLAGALACLEDMLRIAPGIADLWQEAGWLNRRLERFAAAIKCFQRFLQIAPDAPSAISSRAAMDELRARLT